MWSSASPSPSGLTEKRDGETWRFNVSHDNFNSSVLQTDDSGIVFTDEEVDSSAKNITDIYQTWTPVLIFFCALTFFVNVFIVIAARWMRRPLTPTMYFSLSLAAADAVASLTVGLGLVFNR